MVSTRQLTYFVALHECRHFGRAAEKCHVSQPSLSTQVRDLELELGADLVERRGRGVVITPLGEAVAEKARLILAEIQAMKDLARGHAADGLSGVVHLGLNRTLGPYIVPLVMTEVKAAFAACQLVPREEHPDDALAMLRQGDLDAVVAAQPFDDRDLTVVPLFDEPVLVALPAGHPLAAHDAVTGPALAGERLLLLARGHRMRAMAFDLARDFGAVPADDIEGSSLGMLRQMVAVRQGLTLMPGFYALSEGCFDPKVAVRPLDPPRSRRVALAWRSRNPRGAGLARLAEIIATAGQAALNRLPEALASDPANSVPILPRFHTSAN